MSIEPKQSIYRLVGYLTVIATLAAVLGVTAIREHQRLQELGNLQRLTRQQEQALHEAGTVLSHHADLRYRYSRQFPPEHPRPPADIYNFALAAASDLGPIPFSQLSVEVMSSDVDPQLLIHAAEPSPVPYHLLGVLRWLDEERRAWPIHGLSLQQETGRWTMHLRIRHDR